MRPLSRVEYHSAVRSAIAAYAWPGGYPVVAVMADGESLCPSCVRKELRSILSAGKESRETIGAYDHSWLLAGAQVNWEDDMLYCAHCNARIESAYANPETLKDCIRQAASRGYDRGQQYALEGASEPAEWLSGEWAGESIPELLGDLLDRLDPSDHDEVLDAYCERADIAFNWTKEQRDLESRFLVTEYSLPAYWASYLINGDASGLEDGEQETIDAWLEAHKGDGYVTNAGEVDEFSWSNDANSIGGSVATYSFMREKTPEELRADALRLQRLRLEAE